MGVIPCRNRLSRRLFVGIEIGRMRGNGLGGRVAYALAAPVADVDVSRQGLGVALDLGGLLAQGLEAAWRGALDDADGHGNQGEPLFLPVPALAHDPAPIAISSATCGP